MAEKNKIVHEALHKNSSLITFYFVNDYWAASPALLQHPIGGSLSNKPSPVAVDLPDYDQFTTKSCDLTGCFRGLAASSAGVVIGKASPLYMFSFYA